MPASRREFLFQSGAAVATAACLLDHPLQLQADPLGRPVGLQLYTVDQQLREDFDGALTQIAAIGYREVEMPGFYGKKPPEAKAAFSKAGLHCRGVHIPTGQATLEETVEFAKSLGAKYVVSSVLPKRVLDGARANGKFDLNAFIAMLDTWTFDDYKMIAEQCN